MKTPDGKVVPWSEMKPDERFLESFRHFSTMLARWRGGQARLERYRASLRSLEIRIEKQYVKCHLAITCSATTHISCPTWWDNACISIKAGSEQTYVITDDAAEVKIVVGTATVSEVVPPMMTPGPRLTSRCRRTGLRQGADRQGR